MPSYDYSCAECSHRFEVTQSIHSKNRPQECPECGSSLIGRIFAAVPTHFKGSGFYSTDKGKK